MNCSKNCGRDARVGQRYCKECHAADQRRRRVELRDEIRRLRAENSMLKHGGSLAEAIGLKTVA